MFWNDIMRILKKSFPVEIFHSLPPIGLQPLPPTY